MMQWSEMLPDVLDIIAQKYINFYEDYPSFASVCKSWRLAAARTYQNSNGPSSRLPSLMTAGKIYDHESRELFLLSNKSFRKIRLPEAHGKACRSSCGWLQTVETKFASAQLINPLSREIINLPKIDTFPKANYPSYLFDLIQKVVLSMESKLVFVKWDYSKLAFCHIGDNKWTFVETSDYDFILDITFYNGQVYTLNFNKIQACNVNWKDRAVLVDVAITPEYDSATSPAYDSATSPAYDSATSPSYIVGLDDGERKHLLVIIAKEIRRKTSSFQVLAYDLESGNWSKVKDFEKKTLFVGYTSSFWVEDNTGVIKGNCIYYTNRMGEDMRIYHLLDGTFETFTEKSLRRVTPPLWLQSI